jgi:hypothetical protein
VISTDISTFPLVRNDVAAIMALVRTKFKAAGQLRCRWTRSPVEETLDVAVADRKMELTT